MTSGTRPTLMIPGPCQLRAEELAILGQQVQPHYGAAWANSYLTIVDSLARLLGADTVHLLPGSGSAALEAALVNLLQPGHRVVVPDTGYFGRRLAAIATAHRMEAELLPVPSGQPVDSRHVADRLDQADGVLVVHVDTSTGIRNPVAEIARVAREAGAVCLVDAIASAGGEHLDVQRMGIDAAVTASQKGLGAAPGLGIVALDREGHARVRTNRPRTWYFDLKLWEQARIDDAEWEPHPVTMPTNLVEVLGSSVERILRHGLPRWIGERTVLATYLRRRLRGLGLSVVAPETHSANLVTVVTCPDADQVANRVLRYHGILVGRGLAPYENAVLRIGLVGGTASAVMVDRLVDAIAASL